MKNKFFSLAVFIALFSAGCSREQSREVSTPPVGRAPEIAEQAAGDPTTVPGETAISDSTEEDICDDFVVNGLIPSGETRAEVTAKLGAPRQIQQRVIVNKYTPEVADTLVSLHYTGILFEFYRTQEGNEYLNRVLVSDNQYLKYPNLGIGAADTTILRILGTPHSILENEYEYVCQGCDGPEEPVYFAFKDGYVQRVEFTHYID